MTSSLLVSSFDSLSSNSCRVAHIKTARYGRRTINHTKVRLAILLYGRSCRILNFYDLDSLLCHFNLCPFPGQLVMAMQHSKIRGIFSRRFLYHFYVLCHLGQLGAYLVEPIKLPYMPKPNDIKTYIGQIKSAKIFNVAL